MNNYFSDLLSRRIDISSAQRQQGITSHNHARDILHGQKNHNQHFPWLLQNDFLSGSFARKTKLKPLDDIDVMVVIDGNNYSAYDQRGVYGTAESSGTDGSPIDQYLDLRGNVRSSVVVSAFARALNQAYPNATQVRADDQAVNVYFDSYGLGIDVVPCFKVIPNDPSEHEHYFIPAGNGQDSWIKTNPKKDAELVGDVQALHEGRHKQLIKLLKYWNRESNEDRLNSYHLEMMATIAMSELQGNASQNISSTLEYLFNRCGDLVQVNFDDLWGLGDPVCRYLTPAERMASAQQFVRSAELAHTAVRAETVGDTTLATRIWNTIFNE